MMHLAEQVGYRFVTTHKNHRWHAIFETAGAPQLGFVKPDQVFTNVQLKQITNNSDNLV